MTAPALEIRNLQKSFGAIQVANDINLALPRGARHALIGPNGAGKTSLFRMIVGDEGLDAGQLELGSTVKFAYVDQSRDELVGDATVFDEITGGQDRIMVGNRELHARAYVASFGFAGSEAAVIEEALDHLQSLELLADGVPAGAGAALRPATAC